MRAWLIETLGRLLNVGETDTAFGRALLEERYRALQKQIPLLYLVALANFVGLTVASGAPLAEATDPAHLLVLFVVARLAYWHRARRIVLTPDKIIVELRKTLVLAALLSLAFGYWSMRLLLLGPASQQDLVILFTSLAALGCAYGLASFPTAARMPLLLLGLPLAFVLAGSPKLAHMGVGMSLGLVIFLILRLLNVQTASFTELIRSRSRIEQERERAQRAERTALTEKARVRQVADSDPLTGVANRRALLSALGDRVSDRSSRGLALAIIDLDGFKPVNDTFGHAAGDAVLIEVAARLKREAPEALVARIGGDEFAVIRSEDTELGAFALGERVCRALGRPYRIAGREYRISASCGVSLVEPGTSSAAIALGRSDAALYSAKQKGRGCVALFTPQLEAANRRRTLIESSLREPKVLDQFSLVFQPIFDLDSGAIRAFEALARWEHPTLGQIAPSEFIPITEQINVIEQITEAMLARAAAEASRWPAPILLSFNLSAVQLHSAASARRLLRIAARQGLKPARLQIEVTETALLADFDTARLNLDQLRKAGVRIVLDDFGAGFASISYLREMDFDAIKLDGSLLTEATCSDGALRLLKGVIDLTASLGVPCIAEHIETEEQLRLLRRLGCRDGQGFILSEPGEARLAKEMAESRVDRIPSTLTSHRSRTAA
ncbi:MAG TPA: EAL domain-containing protein [Allosphingosinicella sp.]|nr:EAL domain-containing protein [Allosphingosinicella sp.]